MPKSLAPNPENDGPLSKGDVENATDPSVAASDTGKATNPHRLSGPEDPRYLDLNYFPEPKQGQNGVIARFEQVAAVKGRLRQYHIKDNSRTAVPVRGAQRRFQG